MTPRLSYVALFAGLVLVSTAGPFIVASGLPVAALVFWRQAIAAGLLLALAAARGRLVVTRAELAPLVAGALLLTSHFLLWVQAFELTDYGSNLLLLVAQPILAALLGPLVGERLGQRVPLALALAITGLALIAEADLRLGPRALAGDLLCILAGGAIALFYVVTRRIRAALPLETFLGATFGLGALFALPAALATGVPLAGYGAKGWSLLAALVVLTTLGGHGLMNLAARGVPLFTLNLVIVLEPPIGLLLGIPLVGATLSGRQAAGGAVLAAAVVVGLWPARPPAALPAAEATS
jgi:drug/metabolite transporter (DMT)-like permease